MVRKGLALFLTTLLVLTGLPGTADVIWPENTEGQRMLRKYLETVNRYLVEQGEFGINSLFEAYPSLEIFGITDEPEAEVPEAVEITARLFQNSINSLEIRVSDLGRFPRIASSFIQALSPDNGMSREEALRTPTQRMQKAASAPENSFEDQVESLNGTVPYIYYAYYPNQYSDGINWLQMTIIFPMEGYWNGQNPVTGAETTKGPDTYSDHSMDYEGYDSEDDFVHYEIFMTATPEPDSAAAEYDFH